MQRNFTQRLIAWKNATTRKPLLIKGVRQTGKTYTVTEFGNQYFPKMHYVNFEQSEQICRIFDKDLIPKRLIEELSFALDTTINITEDLIFLDEIQACPRAITSLKYFQEGMSELAICAAGSLLGVHLAPYSFPVGKVEFLKVYPMSFEEFLLGIEDNKSVDYLNELHINSEIPEIVHTHLWQRLKHYFVVGGLPEVVETFREHQDNLPNAFELVRKKQTELIDAYYADMAKHSGKVNAMHIDRVWKAVPAQLAKSQDNTTQRFTFKDVVPGVNRYNKLAGAIDWLEAAGLIIKTHICNAAELPLSAYTKENIFKLYVADIGLLGALGNLSPTTIMQYNFGTYKGYFAENFVAQEFLSSGEKDLYSWQGRQSEIEFLREIDGNIIPIEVKSGNITHAKSLKTFIDRYRPSYSVIFSGKNLYIDNAKHIHHYPLYLAGKTPLN
ncbi:MAG: ATP-binding protein [Gammaproteobacteria bacterium]|nr:ATP-binding protein [Gammaproteobacteria bacterium]